MTDTTLVEFDPDAPDNILPVTLSADDLLHADLPPREKLLDPILPAKGLAMVW